MKKGRLKKRNSVRGREEPSERRKNGRISESAITNGKRVRAGKKLVHTKKEGSIKNKKSTNLASKKNDKKPPRAIREGNNSIVLKGYMRLQSDRQRSS